MAGVLLAINTEFVDFRQAATWCARFAEGWTAEHADAACVQAAAGDGRALRRCAAALVWPSLDHAGPSAQRSFQPEAQALAAGLRSRLDIAPDERLALTKSLSTTTASRWTRWPPLWRWSTSAHGTGPAGTAGAGPLVADGSWLTGCSARRRRLPMRAASACRR